MKRSFFTLSRLIALFFLVLAIPVTIITLERGTNFFTRGIASLSGVKASIVVNLTNSSPVSAVPWAHLAQGGEEMDGMISDVIPQTRALAPSYIRIDHVFDFYNVVSRDASGKLAYNWTALDKELSAISQTGAKPFIAISYMPSVISTGSEIDIPRVWSEWQEVTRALIEHVSGTSGLNISDVYYEVWNEPDLFGSFKTSGEKNYLTMYRYAAYGARDARNVKPFKFGGPATTGFYPAWMTSLLSMTARENLRIDFISWHRYSKTLPAFENDYRDARQVLVQFPQYQNLELIITESGYDSNNNEVNDGNLSALHTIALYTENFQKTDRIFHFEIKDGPGPSQYYGRWGLLTNEKHGPITPKPRYRAIQFLNTMRGNFYPVYGQGSWVKAMATTDGETIRVLLVNYDPNGFHTESVPVSLINLPTTNVRLRKIPFNGPITEETFSLTSNNWSFFEAMKANTAVILEIIPE